MRHKGNAKSSLDRKCTTSKLVSLLCSLSLLANRATKQDSHLMAVAPVIQRYDILNAEQTISGCNMTLISSVAPIAFLLYNDHVTSIKITKMRP